ncbi:hypothetical protein QAD02_006488 [Eretmocerus hayati]|uniref:Uncharacterized protein n=1 Tax=Eretmocerus hayati TaxID=131215 RepID=A0ACC2N269_9HYME|nr:hypothetical protein QAD02_006488 [Eretmocerus hayati]
MKLSVHFWVWILLKNVLAQEATTSLPRENYGIEEESLSPECEYSAIDLVCYEVKWRKSEDCCDRDSKVAPDEDLPLDLSIKRKYKDQDDTGENSLPSPKASPGESSYKNFKNGVDSDEHGAKSKSQKTCLCEICGMLIQHKSNFHEHRAKHSDEIRLLCDYCEQNIKTQRDLSQHLKLHKNKGFLSCKICQKTFKTKYKLNRHMGTHSNEFPFSCPMCSKKFKVRESVSQHIRTVHSNNGPHQCQVCDKILSSKYSLYFHMRTHADKNPVKCSVCHKCLTSKYGLAKHMEIHEKKPISCRKCNRSFSQDFELFQHTAYDCGKKGPYVCLVCGNEYIYRSNLQRHLIMKNHGGIPSGSEMASRITESDLDQMMDDRGTCQIAQQLPIGTENLVDEVSVENLGQYEEMKQPEEDFEDINDAICIQNFVRYQPKGETSNAHLHLSQVSLDALGMPACSSGTQNEVARPAETRIETRAVLGSIDTCDSEIDIKEALDIVQQEEETRNCKKLCHRLLPLGINQLTCATWKMCKSIESYNDHFKYLHFLEMNIPGKQKHLVFP